MNLRSVDLNLLVVLDALLDERHVSRAADRIGLSQPAASNALERCRVLFGDPLLERRGPGMQRTSVADTLAPRIKAALAELNAVFTPQDSNLYSLKATVRIATADQPAAYLLPPLYARLSETAPGIRLIIQPWEGGSVPLDRLHQGGCDLAISVMPSTDGDLVSRHVRDDHYVVVMRYGHPAAISFSLEAWLDWPHVLIASDGSTSTPLDGALSRRGLSRTAGLVIPSFVMAPEILRQTDLIAALPSACITEPLSDFAIFDPPVPIESLPLHLVWHRRQNSNQAVQHVAKLMGDILSAA